MRPRRHLPLGALRWRQVGTMCLFCVLMLATALGPQVAASPLPTSAVDPTASAPAAPAQASAITLIVQEYDGGPVIPEFTYLVNEDNTGDPFDPDPYNHPALHHMASHSPIVGAGDETTASFSLPDGRYLISVRADGYKLGGRHLRLPADGGSVVIELVDLVSDPLPLSRLVVYAFEDTVPLNSAPDPLETGLQGFRVHVHDTVGEVTVDWFGNPICTEYDGTGASTPLGDPIPGTGGECLTDTDGNGVVENLPYGKYEVVVLPPDGSGWIQSSTLEEGTRFVAAMLEEGSDGLGPRHLGAQGANEDLLTAFWYGYAQPASWASPGTGTIMGAAYNAIGWPPFDQIVVDTDEPVDRPWVAVNAIGATDELAYMAQGNPDGSFLIPDVPAGVYQLAIWDEPLDYIISFFTVQVAAGETVDMGNLAVPRWRGWISGEVFVDHDRDSIKDPGEEGIPGIDLTTRFRDGSIQQTSLTDHMGYYEFPENIAPLGKFVVTEVGFGRFARTGASVHDDHDPNIVTALPDEFGGGLLASQLTWESRRSIIDWGKLPYGPNENGGISGMVLYATTRNEFNARNALAEPYEPGIPGVTVRLWGLGPDAEPNTADDVLLNEITTDAWEHPTAANGNACDLLDANGNPLPDPIGVGPNCIEVPMVANETHDGAYDGGYAFESYWFPYFGAPAALEMEGLPPGDYVVEVVEPEFYQILKEEDLNTLEGNELVPAIPPPPCVGDLHLADVPDEYGSPYDGEMMPLCDKRLVTLHQGQNAGAEFFLFTDLSQVDRPGEHWSSAEAVPIPGRFFGLVEDDLVVNTDPNSVTFGEKRGVPFLPIGVRDFTGRLITTVQTDEVGYFEVLLPSTFQANCPTPSGVCPGMYFQVTNDPGEVSDPNVNFNGGYMTAITTWDVWPGKMTPTDTPSIPLAAANCAPLHGDDPIAEPGTFPPEIYAVSQPYGSPGDAFAITGPRFGPIRGSGQVTIDGVPLEVTSWSDFALSVKLPLGLATGPGQLLVTTADGQTSLPGLTFHVVGAGYNPPMLTVDDDGPADYATVQAAIDAASPGALIVVKPGTYRENVIMHQAVKLQGYGQGGLLGTDDPRTLIEGSVIDGRYYRVQSADWETLLAGLSFDGNQAVPGGACITVVASDAEFTSGFPPSIDGFRITSGRAGIGGGGIHVNGYARYLEISNNYIEENGSLLAGGISLGQPYVGNNENDFVDIHHNRIVGNGGRTAGGGIGIFNGGDNYQISHNRMCGNYSAQYGGGIAHFGLSHDGHIHHNMIYYNDSFDEGGGVMIAGELSSDPAGSTGSGAVDLSHNLIQANLANDDGGGIRLLQPLDHAISISNNMIVNNVSTDLGGGISLDDASDVVIVNNTVAGNQTTATAEDSDGLAHAAGLMSEAYSQPFTDYLVATYSSAAPGFPDPVLFNNIFWENEAYTWDGAALALDSTFDMEVFGTPAPSYFSPVYSLLSVPYGGGDPSNIVGSDPLFVSPAAFGLTAVPFRADPNFITVLMGRPLTLPGDYHLTFISPAIDEGTASHSSVNAPPDDFDDQSRPQGPEYDMGADELFIINQFLPLGMYLPQ